MTGRNIIDRIVGSLSVHGIVANAPQRRADRLASLLRTLVSERGEASGALMARRAVALYRGLDSAGRLHFFERLAKEFSPQPDAVVAAALAYQRDPSAGHLAQLQRVAEPPRQEVFRRMNMAPGAMGTLLDLRRELVGLIHKHPHLAAVDQDLTHLLGSWFNRGFLELRRIDWKTSAAILEKLIAYEAVHEIRGFPDLRRRLEHDRRCFAFFHPALPDEPLIFVEVAFVNELPSEVGPILAMESAVGNPRRARCAVFYSITSCQPGLKGISFGNFLIKQVASDLHAELPNLRMFATLSPIPGFRAWAGKAAPQVPCVTEAGTPSADDRETLEALAAWYLTHEWDGSHARDPVARFHLGNGARLERLNWHADMSSKGLAQSFGLMVNYVYDLATVERNHEEYVKKRHVVCSGAIEKLARAAEPLLERPAAAASAPRPA